MLSKITRNRFKHNVTLSCTAGGHKIMGESENYMIFCLYIFNVQSIKWQGIGDGKEACRFTMAIDKYLNHKNYNFLDCDWFKKTPLFH